MKVYLCPQKHRLPMDSYIIKHAFRYFLPAAILTGIILQVRIITDCIIVGHLIGPDALSAINLYIPLEETVYSFISVLVVGASFLGAECIGRQDYRGASHYFTVSLASSSALALALVGLIVLFFQPVISLLAGGEDSVIRSSTFTYTLYMLPTFVLMAPSNVLRYFVNIEGKPRLVTVSILVSFLLNPVLDYVLIRFAGMGLAGAALATFASDLAGLVVLSLHFLRKQSIFRLQRPENGSRVLGSSIRMGIPLSASLFLLAAVSVLLNRLVFSFKGAEGLYVWSVAVQIIALCEMILEGVSDMNQSIGGTLLGSCDFKSFHAYARRSLRFVHLTILAVSLLLLLFPDTVFSLFGVDGDQAAGAEARSSLRILALYLLPDMLLAFYENIHSLVRQERLSLVFQFLHAGALALLPFLAGKFLPALFWWSFPLLGALLSLAQYLAALHIQHRQRNVQAPFLAETFPTDVEADFTVDYTQESFGQTLEKIRTVAAICELPSGKETFLNICCEDLMNNLLLRKAEDKSMRGRFEIRLVDKPELTRVTFKSAGKPFNPVIRFDQTAYERFCKGEPLDLELELINKLSDRIDHRYLYGVNVTTVEFLK